MDRTRPRGRLGHRPAAVLEAIIPLTTPTVPVVYLAAPPTAITPTAYKSLFFADPLTLDTFVSPISTSHSLIRQSYLPPDMYLRLSWTSISVKRKHRLPVSRCSLSDLEFCQSRSLYLPVCIVFQCPMYRKAAQVFLISYPNCLYVLFVTRILPKTNPIAAFSRFQASLANRWIPLMAEHI